MSWVRAATGWWLPLLPRQRVAWLRAVVAVTAVVDAAFLLTSPRNRAGTPEFYEPVPLARLLQLPAPTPTSTWALMAAVALGAVLLVAGGTRRAPVWTQHLGGASLAVGYGAWVLYGMSFGYVAHDHMAITAAVWLLPTAGTCRYGGTVQLDRRAGWALRMVQVLTVATYTGSLLAKWVMSGGDLLRWANSATLAWAFLRRPSPLNQLLVDQAVLLRLAQWGALVLELGAPVVFLLSEHRRIWLLAGFAGFHAATFALLGIHFLPTLVCWAAFLPLERLEPWWRSRRAISAPTGATA